MSPLPALSRDHAQERLDFAHLRLDEFLSLGGGRLAGADGPERQRLIQEFFFHLLGATDFLAQYVNQARNLGQDFEQVSMGTLHDMLPISDPLGVALRQLYVNTRKTPFPADSYSDDALVYRAYNYRHLVTHRRTFPFLFRVGAEPPASLVLDPRLEIADSNISVVAHDVELRKILLVICDRVAQALAAI